MDIRKTARGAWLGVVAGLLIGAAGAPSAAAADKPKSGAATPKPQAAEVTAAGAPVDKGETKEVKAKRLEHEGKVKTLRSTGLQMDLNNLKALREEEKVRKDAEEAKKTPRVFPGMVKDKDKDKAAD